MKNGYKPILLVMLVLAVITACTSRVTPTQGNLPERDEKTAGLVPEVTTTPDICEDSIIQGITFPRQEPAEGPREVMEAELLGNLILADGCLRIESLYNDGSYLPIWPPEFTLNLESDIPVILDGEGTVVGRVGEEIYMGGGTGSEAGLPACVRQQLPNSCGGPFWIVGEGVKFNLQFDSDLFDLEVIEDAERAVILLYKKPILDDWIEEHSLIAGNLVLYPPMRCPRIQSESGMTDFLPIWLPDYAVQFRDGLLEIMDESGEVIAREGEEVVLHGGMIPHSWDSEHYRQLHYDLPGDCLGPYWVVEE